MKKVPSKQNEERLALLTCFFFKSRDNGNVYWLVLLAVQRWTDSGPRSAFLDRLLVAPRSILPKRKD